MTHPPADDPLRPHSHEPNPEPPSLDPAFILSKPDGREIVVSVDELQRLPRTTVANCAIVSTGHGVSGPFAFTGATLLDLVRRSLPPGAAWAQVEVISYMLDGQPLTRQQGLVRLIVPSSLSERINLPDFGSFR